MKLYILYTFFVASFTLKFSLLEQNILNISFSYIGNILDNNFFVIFGFINIIWFISSFELFYKKNHNKKLLFLGYSIAISFLFSILSFYYKDIDGILYLNIFLYYFHIILAILSLLLLLVYILYVLIKSQNKPELAIFILYFIIILILFNHYLVSSLLEFLIFLYIYQFFIKINYPLFDKY